MTFLYRDFQGRTVFHDREDAPVNLLPVPDLEEGQVRLSIEWPKERERFNLSGKGLFTDVDLASLIGCRVGGPWSGVVRSANYDALANDGQGGATITIIVDEATVNPGIGLV